MNSKPSAESSVGALLRALEQAWNAGSPVAGSSPELRDAIAGVALGRINSFSRRGIPSNDHDRQVQDLARGLWQKFEAEPDLIGPLRTDYQHLAEKLLNAYSR